MLVSDNDKDNNKLKELYIKNYSYDRIFTPQYRYTVIIHSKYLWFHLVNNNDEIIGCCSVNKDKIYTIGDVYIEKKFRGNNYAVLLLINVIDKIIINDNNARFQIMAHDTNIAAIITYQKIFGNPSKKENNMIYFQNF